jgi:hypothetical protein
MLNGTPDCSPDAQLDCGATPDQACILLKESVYDLLLNKYAEVEGNRLQADVRFLPAILAGVCATSRAVEGSVQ